MQKFIDSINSIGNVPVSLFLITIGYAGYIIGWKYGINDQQTSMMIIGVAIRHLFTDTPNPNDQLQRTKL